MSDFGLQRIHFLAKPYALRESQADPFRALADDWGEEYYQVEASGDYRRVAYLSYWLRRLTDATGKAAFS